MPVQDAIGIAKWVGGALLGKLKNEGDVREIEAAVKAKVETALINEKELNLKTNLADAKARSFIQSSWRPMIGHYAGFGFAYSVFLPLLNWLVSWANAGFAFPIPELPTIDTSQLVVILTGMLGISGLRTYEKKQGIDGGRLGKADS